MLFDLSKAPVVELTLKRNRIKLLSIPDEVQNMEYNVNSGCKRRKFLDVSVRYPGYKDYFPMNDFTKFKNDILNTVGKYVYPVVFINYPNMFAKSGSRRFKDEHLRKLQLWGNQLRDVHGEIYEGMDENEYITKIRIVDYLTYVILVKSIKYLRKDSV